MIQTLQSKVVPPRRQPKILRRVRLLDIMHNNIHRKVVFVCAQAGYGKTTLLVDFAEDVDAEVFWYRITPEDQTLVKFLENIIYSFQQKYPNFGEGLNSALDTEDLTGLAWARALITEIETKIDDFSILVLDDFHLVSNEPAIVDFLESFLINLPDRLRILIGSRNVYGIPTALLYVQENLAIISEEDLKFQQDEIMELCQKYYKIHLTDDQCSRILTQAEGWIVAILLALRSENLSLEIPKITGAREHVYTYLADEVLRSLPKQLIRFMHATSLVEEFTVPMANYILEIDNAAEIIKQLDDLNLFLSLASADGDGSYRYHQLFADFLQGNFKETHPEDVQHLHIRIAEWYGKINVPVDAISHYFKGGDEEQASKLIDQVSGDLYLSGQVRNLEKWYARLSDTPELLSQTPGLLLNLAKSKLNVGEFEEGGELLNLAEKQLLLEEDHTRYVTLLITRGMLMRFTARFETAWELAEEVQKLVDEYDLDRYYWYQAERLKGMSAFYLSEPEKALRYLLNAAQVFREAVKDSPAYRQAHDLLMTLADIGYIALSSGNIYEAQRSYRESLDLARQVRGNPTDLANALNNYAYLNFLLGYYQEAWMHYLQAMEVADTNSLTRHKAYILNGQADVLRDIGEWEEAREKYIRAKDLAEKLGEVSAEADALSGLVDVETHVGLYHQAMFYLRELARVQEGNIDAPIYQMRLAKIYMNMGQFNLAEKNFSEALTNWNRKEKITQDLTDLRFHYGLILARLKKTDEAKRMYEATLEDCAALGYDHFLVNYVRRHIKESGPILEKISTPQTDILLLRAKEALPSMKALVEKEEPEPEERFTLNVYGLDHGNVRINNDVLSPRSWGSVGARALFYFILDRGQTTKDEIALQFWPDFSQAKINSNFHATLWRVRNALGSKHIIAFENEYYKFSSDVQIYYDVSEFENLFSLLEQTDSMVEIRSALRRMVEIYQTDFIDDIYMDWADQRREKLRRQYIHVLTLLADEEYAKSNFSTTLEYLEKIAVMEPFQDDIHLKIIDCFVRRGEPFLARKHYESYNRRLKKEMGLVPDERLQAYIQQME